MSSLGLLFVPALDESMGCFFCVERFPIRRLLRGIGIQFLPLSLLVMSGCGGPEYGHVQGVVLLDGQPISDVEVQFIPLPNQRFDGQLTSVYTDTDGNFSSAASGRAGVLVGVHHVCLSDARIMMAKNPSVSLEDGERVSPDSRSSVSVGRQKSTPRIPQSYSDAQYTPFRNIDVQSGLQSFKFELQSKR